MIAVDSSAWIEFFNRPRSQVAKKLDRLLTDEFVIIGDLVYCEVMQGIEHPAHRRQVAELLGALNQVTLGGFAIAGAAAANFRTLRSKGITVRKTIDCIIATYCIEHGVALLHTDRDFDPFEKHLGLEVI